MADYTVYVVNEGEISTYDTSAHSTLEEIRDLLRLILQRLPEPSSDPQSDSP